MNISMFQIPRSLSYAGQAQKNTKEPWHCFDFVPSENPGSKRIEKDRKGSKTKIHMASIGITSPRIQKAMASHGQLMTSWPPELQTNVGVLEDANVARKQLAEGLALRRCN